MGRKGRDGKGRANEPQKLQRGAAKFQRRKGSRGRAHPAFARVEGFRTPGGAGGRPAFLQGRGF